MSWCRVHWPLLQLFPRIFHYEQRWLSHCFMAPLKPKWLILKTMTLSQSSQHSWYLNVSSMISFSWLSSAFHPFGLGIQNVHLSVNFYRFLTIFLVAWCLQDDSIEQSPTSQFKTEPTCKELPMINFAMFYGFHKTKFTVFQGNERDFTFLISKSFFDCSVPVFQLFISICSHSNWHRILSSTHISWLCQKIP